MQEYYTLVYTPLMPPNFFFFQRSLTSAADGKPSELLLSVGAIFLNRKVVQCTMYKNS